MSDSLSLGSGPYHFFARSSFSAALSSIDSANSFFSLRFSSSSIRSRLTSDTSRPPYLLFQLQSCFRDPVLARQLSRLCPTLVLAQNRNDLLFREPATLHRPSLQHGRTLILRGGKTQWQVNVGQRKG